LVTAYARRAAVPSRAGARLGMWQRASVHSLTQPARAMLPMLATTAHFAVPVERQRSKTVEYNDQQQVRERPPALHHNYLYPCVRWYPGMEHATKKRRCACPGILASFWRH
jgi:hypothetical protein